MDALSRAAGISKRTLYERFGSKDGLIVAAYESLDVPVFVMFTGPAEAASDTPRGQLDAALRAARGDGAAAPSSVAARSRMPPPSSPTSTIRPTRSCAGTRSGCASGCSTRAREAGAADPDELSRQLMIVFAGAQSQALVQRSPLPVRDAREVARALVASATVR